VALSVLALGMVPNRFSRPDLTVGSNRVTSCTWCNNLRFAHNITFPEQSPGVFEPEGVYYYNVGTADSDFDPPFDVDPSLPFPFPVSTPTTSDIDRFAVVVRPVVSVEILGQRKGPGGESSPRQTTQPPSHAPRFAGPLGGALGQQPVTVSGWLSSLCLALIVSFLFGRDGINAVSVVLFCAVEFFPLAQDFIFTTRARIQRATGRFRVATGTFADRVSGLPLIFHYGFISGLLGGGYVASGILYPEGVTVAILGHCLPLFAIWGLPSFFFARFVYHSYYGGIGLGAIWVVGDLQSCGYSLTWLEERVSLLLYVVNHHVGNTFSCVYELLSAWVPRIWGWCTQHLGRRNAPMCRCSRANCCMPVHSRFFCWFCGRDYCMCPCPICDPEGIWNLRHRAATHIQRLWRAYTPRMLLLSHGVCISDAVLICTHRRLDRQARDRAATLIQKSWRAYFPRMFFLIHMVYISDDVLIFCQRRLEYQTLGRKARLIQGAWRNFVTARTGNSGASRLQPAFLGAILAIFGILVELLDSLRRVLLAVVLRWRVFSGGVTICLLILVNLSGAFAVTCRQCYDQIEGCTGGENCPLLTGVTANAAVLGAAAGSTLIFKVNQMLPRPYLRICTRAVLDSIKSVFKRPLVAGQDDLSNMSIEALARAVKEGTSPRSDVLMAVMQLAAQVDADDTPETRSQQRKIDHLISIIRELNACQSRGESASRAPETVGVLALIWALAGKVSDHSSESKASVSFADSKEGDSVVTKLSEKQRRSRSMEECSERISAFTAICHALGIANVLLTTQFFREVFYDTVLRDKQPWQLAHELVLVYLEDVDQSTTLTMGNVFASGAQDTRLKRAAAECLTHYKLDIFRSGPGGPEQKHASGSVKSNGKFTKTAKQVCHSFNFGKPCTHLLPDGTCKFNHTCNHWVSDKGPKGRCEGSHPQSKCDNPNKCDSPVA
jgi:hypothetical protein